MQTLLLVFYCCICFSLVFGGGPESILPDDEVSALLVIKSGIVDAMNHLKDWSKPKSVQTYEMPIHCNWTGVHCNEEGFVEKLILSNMNLTGNISDRIQRFGFLQVLDLSQNGFESSLPKSLSNLTSLKSIELSMNGFFGNFPHGLGMATGLSYVNASNNNFSGFLPEDLGNATMLETLDLRGGYFRGTIPSSFKNLKNLRFLGLSGNSLGGKLPREMGELSALETAILGYNEFEGNLPEEFGNLKNLRYLDLAVGNLTGEIPSSLGRLKQLMTLYLYENNFSGKIPKEVGNITSLVFLDLSDNQISGEIPEELADLKNLQLLNLMRNQLTGRIPEKIGELQSLEVLELWQNNLNGYLPANLGNNSPLKWLDVSTNSLSGEIPSGLCDSGNLTKLILFNNSFSGVIPSSLSTCKSLVRVRIQNNLIAGSIPVGLGSLPMLQRLELAKNNLSGHIPEDLASSDSISFVDVSSNNLKSSIPSSLFSSPKLQTFIASNNNLEGKIPDQFQDCPSMSILDLSSNFFSAEIPESLASCEKLVNLNLGNNNLTGEIPKSLARLPTLAILDLSNNSLTGKIPQNFGASPALETFNLSFNKLEGPVPSNRLFAAINPNDLIGNSGLCGGVLPPCPRHTALPESWKHPGKVHVNHVIFGFVIGTSVVLSLAIMFCIGRCVYRRWDLYRGCWRSCLFLKKPSEEWPWRLVAFQRVCFTANDILACVKESNIIGMGATGIVYKAEMMKRPHTIVAVKKLWRSPQGDVEEDGEDILNEVSLLGRLRHRNIVRLLGYVHNESEVMVIYEFMPNGNLGSALHSNDGNDGKKTMMMLVDWVSRYNVAVGVAQGLDYLHNDCHPPVIHRDIKSNNILLDSNMEARIADFGLARMMIHKNETVSMVAGSYGYIAPEYGYTLKVDEKSDIYSFGVVLLELVTGKMPLDPSFGESTDIVGWIREKMKKNISLEQVLDRNISGECKNVKEEMLLALRIALLCTAKLPKDRPTMGDVISMLSEAKPRRKSVCQDRSNVERPVFNNSPVIGLM